jgi:hypothetical protein
LPKWDNVYKWEFINMPSLEAMRLLEERAKEQPVYSDAQERAYEQLQTAGERIGMNNYSAGLAAHIKKGRKRSTYNYQVTEAHAEIVAAMPKVLDGSMTPEEACNLINSYDVEKQRLGI